MAGREDLLPRFAQWLMTLQPELWEEVRAMASQTKGIIDWEAVSKVKDIREVVKFLPPEDVIETLGVESVLKAVAPRLTSAQAEELLRKCKE